MNIAWASNNMSGQFRTLAMFQVLNICYMNGYIDFFVLLLWIIQPLCEWNLIVSDMITQWMGKLLPCTWICTTNIWLMGKMFNLWYLHQCWLIFQISKHGTLLIHSSCVVWLQVLLSNCVSSVWSSHFVGFDIANWVLAPKMFEMLANK